MLIIIWPFKIRLLDYLRHAAIIFDYLMFYLHVDPNSKRSVDHTYKSVFMLVLKNVIECLLEVFSQNISL